MAKELDGGGITLAFARVRDQVRERMRLGGVEAVVGPNNFHERITDGVAAFQAASAPSNSLRDRMHDSPAVRREQDRIGLNQPDP